MSSHEMLVGRYELRGVLGCGGMAEVRDAWDTRLNRAVAIKTLHPAMVTQPDIRRRFEDEARAAAALSHPNIVGVHDCDDLDGTPFIVMERLPGDTLHDLIARGPIPSPRVREILADVLGALTVAHRAGILHRDIKPGNVLVAADGTTMKVADFGIAKTAGSAHTMTGQIIGTMAYMSPERIAGSAASVADDVYAVGVIAYEAVTGLLAFPQDNPAAMAYAIMQAGPPSVRHMRPDVDPALADIIDRAMARDPRRRFTSAAQMHAALRGDQTAMGPPVVLPAPPRPATKILDTPVPAGASGTFVSPDASFYVPAKKRRPAISRNKKFLAASGVFVALLVTVLAFATDRSSTTQVTEPVSTSTQVSAPVSAPPPPPPPPVATPVVQEPDPPEVEDKKDEKKGDEKKGEVGRGNGNGGQNGNGNKKRG
ncbi:serine/threonine-protein kinase [Mycobacterium sp. NPDC003323]